jgi:hypothetical protein
MTGDGIRRQRGRRRARRRGIGLPVAGHEPPPNLSTSNPRAASVATVDGSSVAVAGAPAAGGRDAPALRVVRAMNRASACLDVIQRRPSRTASRRTRFSSGPGRPLDTQRQTAARASGRPDRVGGRIDGSDPTGTSDSESSVAASSSWLLMATVVAELSSRVCPVQRTDYVGLAFARFNASLPATVSDQTWSGDRSIHP